MSFKGKFQIKSFIYDWRTKNNVRNKSKSGGV